MSREDDISQNLKKVLSELKGYQANLIAVSKTKPHTDIEKAYECGQKIFGENKVQELLEKAQALKSICPEIQWHFIGHLQSNKINLLLSTPHLASIHSIDSIKLLNKLLSKNPDRSIGVFLQVNTSQEDEKSGFETFEELHKAIQLLQEHKDFYFQGLMTIGKIRTQDFETDAKKCFAKLVDLKHDLSHHFPHEKFELSMGMSQDYPIALELGADWIRVGSKIFGSRISSSSVKNLHCL